MQDCILHASVLIQGESPMFTFGHGRRNVLYEVLYLLFIRDLAEQTASCKLNKIGLMSIEVQNIRTVISFPYEDLFRLNPLYKRNR